jgi:hypothetical protein
VRPVFTANQVFHAFSFDPSLKCPRLAHIRSANFSMLCSVRFRSDFPYVLAFRSSDGEPSLDANGPMPPRLTRFGGDYWRQVGLGFLIGAFLSRSAQSVSAGFGEARGNTARAAALSTAFDSAAYNSEKASFHASEKNRVFVVCQHLHQCLVRVTVRTRANHARARLRYFTARHPPHTCEQNTSLYARIHRRYF